MMPRSTSCLVWAGVLGAFPWSGASAQMPFSQEIQQLSHERPRLPFKRSGPKRPGFTPSSRGERQSQNPKTDHSMERQGPLVPPLVDFIAEIDSGLSLPAPTPDPSPILRSFDAHLDLPEAYSIPDLNMRLPTPW